MVSSYFIYNFFFFHSVVVVINALSTLTNDMLNVWVFGGFSGFGIFVSFFCLVTWQVTNKIGHIIALCSCRCAQFSQWHFNQNKFKLLYAQCKIINLVRLSSDRLKSVHYSHSYLRWKFDEKVIFPHAISIWIIHLL